MCIRDSVLTAAHCLVNSINRENNIGFYEDLKVVAFDVGGEAFEFEVLEPSLKNIHLEYRFRDLDPEKSVFVENADIDLAYLQMTYPLDIDIEYPIVDLRDTEPGDGFISGFGLSANKKAKCLDSMGRFCWGKNVDGHTTSMFRKFAAVDIFQINSDSEKVMYQIINEKKWYKKSPQASNGDSGGSLYDKDMSLIGVVTGGLKEQGPEFDFWFFKSTSDRVVYSDFVALKEPSNRDFLYEIIALDSDIQVIE